MHVSVIMPAYNAASTIADAIASVLRQTSPHWELIVVDDGSADATAGVAGRFVERDDRISIVQQGNAGESAARNTGIAHSHYDWLLFLDADDWIAPHLLERMAAELRSHPEFDAIHCGWVRVALDGTHVSDDYQPPVGDLFPTLALRAAFPVNACIVRRSLVEAVGAFDTSLKKSADWDLWQRIARTGAGFGAVREVLAYYRMTPNSSSLEAEQLLRDGLTVLKRGSIADARVRNPHPEYADGLRDSPVQLQQFYLLCWCAGLLLGSGRDARKLLDLLTSEGYAELYPDALARCVFQAGTLPSCQPPSAWERLWPEVERKVEEFFTALEERAQIPDLTSRSLFELKKLISRHSLTWGPVLDQHELTIRELEDLKHRYEALRRENDLLRSQLGKWQGITEERELIIANLQQQAWVRLGLRCGAVKRPDIGTAMVGAESKLPSEASGGMPGTTNTRSQETVESKWELRVAGRSLAQLVIPPQKPEAVRVAIARATRTAWDIQLNLARLKVNANQRYSIHFRARADGPRPIAIGVTKAYEPWTGLGLYKELELTREWQTFQEEFTSPESDENARVHFDLGGRKVGVEIEGLVLLQQPDEKPIDDNVIVQVLSSSVLSG